MKKQILYISLISIIILLLVDIIIRIYYCRGIYLKFDSAEFNNITTPIISFLGFIAVIITILISIRQLKISTSEKYLTQFNEYIKLNFDEIKKSDVDNLPFEKGELIKFFPYVRLKYEDLLEDKNYVLNSQLIKKNDFNLFPITYENILGELRLFNIQSILLYKGYLNKLQEITSNSQIIENHKEIILSNFINDILGDYIESCKIIKENYPEMIEDFFHTIDFRIKEKPRVLYFFDSYFFELFDNIMENEELKKFYKNQHF